MNKIEFKPNQTLLFIGDSITDAQRRERPYSPLGWGYVHFAANFLLAARPFLNLNIQNRGIGGDTTGALLTRWDTDCIALKPDIVSLMIGINDLWRKFGESRETQRMYIGPVEYQTNLTELLQRTKNECGSQLILMEPYMFSDNPTDSMLNELPRYIDIVHTLAQQFEAVLVPVHTSYMALKQKRPAIEWANDAVHPTEWAHAWIARQWLNTVIGE
ncbi:MAG: SGNH/GDSL hydrolase family protein [Phycisphaerae bacterium]|nr:SGNH/GDSL hydrolase family protein [Phycisphaerae bacterium]